MFRHTEEWRARVVYHDWYRGTQYNATQSGSDEAYAVCEGYEKHAGYDDGIPRAKNKEQRTEQIKHLQDKMLQAFYPQLRAVNASQCSD